jgi:hypothetical protein
VEVGFEIDGRTFGIAHIDVIASKRFDVKMLST